MDDQPPLFDLEQFTAWREDWRGMPDYIHEDLRPWKTILVHFEDREALDALSLVLGQTLTEQTDSIWFPRAEIVRMVDKRYRNVTAAPREPKTLEERLPESPTRSRVYGDWANHETWMLTILVLDDPVVRRLAIESLDAEDPERSLQAATASIWSTRGYDDCQIAWSEVLEELRTVR